MLKVNIVEFNSEKEGMNILPPPENIHSVLVLFYSNGFSAFPRTVNAIFEGDKAVWNESHFMHWDDKKLLESERIPFRSYLCVGKDLSWACADRNKLRSEEIFEF